MSITRRKFLIGTGLAGGGLILGFQLKPSIPIPNLREDTFKPNAWLQITEAGEVIFQLDKSEMGQGVYTTLPTIIGEELDFNPENIIVEQAGIHPEFINTAMGVQLTGASSTSPSTWVPLREAGASARAMLLTVAAKEWGAKTSDCETNDGTVIHKPSGKTFTYGELATKANQSGKISADFELKKSSQYRWIGTPIKRKDAKDKIQGSAVFGMDVDFEDIMIAVVRRCPHYGGSLQSYDDSKAKSMDGVQSIFTIHSGVAVVADSYWQARKAADSIKIVWDKGPLAGLDSATILERQRDALKTGDVFNVVDEGDFEKLAANADEIIEVNYSAPYQHHSPMEPQNTTAKYANGNLEVWSPSQGPDLAQAVISHFTGIPREDITVHTTLLGGGFGRRGYVDFAGEAGAIAKGYPNTPVKLIWSREDDMRHDYYRPATYHGLKAVIQSGNIEGWHHNIVSTSIIQGFGIDLISTMLPNWLPIEIGRNFSQGLSDMVAPYDITMAEGAKLPYAIPSRDVGVILYDPGITTGFWRSVGHSHNAFVVESFIDECAHAVNIDPATFRIDRLDGNKRLLSVLNKALEISGYQYENETRHVGIAAHESFGSFVAQIAEVEVAGNNINVKRVYCVADCGLVINPDIVTAQMESGIVYGLSATLKPGVSFKDGATVESNFHDLPVLRMNECPDIIVSLIDSTEDPSGVGEISVPPIAAAVANAVFKATGQRLRDLPLTLS